MQLKIESLEDQMDLKVESLISEIHKHRDEYMEKLNKFKMDLKKLILFSGYFCFINSVLKNSLITDTINLEATPKVDKISE